jgi:hypothetical protein
MTELLTYFRDRSLDEDGAGFALAYALLRLAESLEELSKTFHPPKADPFKIDYGLIRMAQRLDRLAKELGTEPLGALAARLAAHEAPQPDPPEAEEFLSHRRRRRPREAK